MFNKTLAKSRYVLGATGFVYASYCMHYNYATADDKKHQTVYAWG